MFQKPNWAFSRSSNDEIWGLSKIPNLMLVDTRQEWEYRTGHLKGPLIFPWNPRPVRWRNKGMKPLGPDKNRLVFY
jgi:rhodanese-related sulfurtransferase